MSNEQDLGRGADPMPEQSAGRAEREAGNQGEDQAGEQVGGIHFHFPIDIRLVDGSDGDLVDQVVERVFDELRRELERRA
ncbi:hypothetical protein GCM10011575_34860 [Microlunatus endophyticus]|uniref:Uncharacterized protein n=1 Tax=Microlunatus endophyticus TaxID=1716077 RepID=A0A917SE06_9ACTN|nr:hypothetical protein [Microlunatus endophyticus]GGL73558.1 hypothetical protein GCM10011575_34860 [Microlunatus endophyticus]